MPETRYGEAQVCEECGVGFQRYRAPADRNRGRFCSRKCVIAFAKRTMPRRMGCICKTCGSRFERTLSAIRDGEGHYCSRSCSTSSRMREWWQDPEWRAKMLPVQKAVGASRWKPPVEFTCQQCGAVKALGGSKRTRAMKQRFCSQRCHGLWVGAHPELNPNVRGGRDEYYGPGWHEQARLTRERDHHTCQDCGKDQRFPLLDVHHIVPRRMFDGDHGRMNALNNLVSLCKPCHTLRERALTVEMQDAKLRFPGAVVRPRMRGSPKITPQQALEILKRYDRKQHNGIALAREFGISSSAIYGLINRRTWPHLDRGNRSADEDVDRGALAAGKA